ncbi:hypothetical protein N5C36_10000 [Shewanella xiamenensis]|uniref:hypothetical protein n=1 Tax=Shewanella TaxID=22 RepID=UPI00201AB168|nr:MULTISPECIES: hypothetical protein [Shewanella]MDH1314415.1 hypothetical protein [Shewanella xiamenensis]
MRLSVAGFACSAAVVDDVFYFVKNKTARLMRDLHLVSSRIPKLDGVAKVKL